MRSRLAFCDDDTPRGTVHVLDDKIEINLDFFPTNQRTWKKKSGETGRIYLLASKIFIRENK